MLPPPRPDGTNAVLPIVPSFETSRSPSASLVFANLAARPSSHCRSAATSIVPLRISVTRTVGTPVTYPPAEPGALWCEPPKAAELWPLTSGLVSHLKVACLSEL